MKYFPYTMTKVVIVLLLCLLMNCYVGSSSDTSSVVSTVGFGDLGTTENNRYAGVPLSTTTKQLSTSSTLSSVTPTVLLVSTLDGKVTALSADTGTQLWSIRTGDALLGAYQHETVYNRSTKSSSSSSSSTNNDGSAYPNPPTPYIIPSRDGSIMLSSSSGLQQLPYRAQELVSRLPFAAGANLLVGAKITRLFEISVSKGTILSEISGTDGTCPPKSNASSSSSSSQTNTEEEDDSSSLSTATVWIGRTDYIVQAFDTEQRSGLWNVTYGEITLPSSSFYDSSSGSGSTGNYGTSRKENHSNSPGSTSSSSSSSSSSSPLYNEYIHLATALTQRYTLQTTMHGDIFATDTNTGEFIWQALSLQAPVSNIFVMGINQEGKTIQTSVPFSEFWPQGNAAVWKKSSSIGPGTTTNDNTDASSSTPSDTPIPPLLPKSQVFIGILSNGQLYASPKTHYSIDLPQNWRTKMGDSKTVSSITATGEILYLPAPEGGIHPEGISNQLITSNTNDDYIHDIVEQEFIDHCTTLFHSNEPNTPPSCLIGLHNVSFIIDTTIAASHSNLLPALPPYLALPTTDTPITKLPPQESSSGVIIIPEISLTAQVLSLPEKFLHLVINIHEFYYRTTVSIATSIYHLTHDQDTVPSTVVVDTVYAILVLTTLFVIVVVMRELIRWHYRTKAQNMANLTKTINNNPLSMLPTITDDVNSSTTTDSSNAVTTVNRRDIRKIIDGVAYRFVGRLGISDKLLGYGSHGTMVYEGLWDSRPVAVKRLLRVLHPAAKREVSLLVKTDGHSNVVRYFTFEEAEDFLYLALELCECSLASALENCINTRMKKLNKVQQQQLTHTKPLKGQLPLPIASSSTTKNGKSTGTGTNRLSIGSSNAYAILDDTKDSKKAKKKKKGNQYDTSTELIDNNPVLGEHNDKLGILSTNNAILPVPIPTPATRAFLREIVNGVAHLHRHRIVHRDIKPHNILLARKTRNNPEEENNLSVLNSVGYTESEYHNLGLLYIPKISDFGLGKQLDLETSSFGHQGLPVPNISNPQSIPHVGSSLGFHPRLGSLMNDPGHTSSHASGAIAPGSVGWQAPEIIIPVLRARAQMGALPPLPETMQEEDERDLSITHTNSATNTNGINVASPTPTNTDNNDAALFRQSRAADVWSLGCLIYTVLDPGGHPFGAPYEREANIVKGQAPNLSRINHLPLAVDLISSLVSRDPRARPTAEEALEHPFFWTDEEALNFLCDVSDKLEAESGDITTGSSHDNKDTNPKESLDGVLTTALEQWGSIHNFLGDYHTVTTTISSSSVSAAVTVSPPYSSVSNSGGNGWIKRFPNNFILDSGRHRRYDPDSIADCLRLLRNKRNHFQEIPLPLRQSIFSTVGTDNPVILYPFFTSRIPKLVYTCYSFALRHLAHERNFAVRLGPLTAQQYASSSLLEVQKLTQQRIQYIASLSMNSSNTSSSSNNHSNGSNSTKGLTNKAGTKLPVSRGWFSSTNDWFTNSSVISNRTIQTSGGTWVKATVDQDGSTNIGLPLYSLTDKHTLVQQDTLTKNMMVLVVSAYDRMVESRYQGGAHVYDQRYKSRTCKDWDQDYGKGCPRGIRCDFAHGTIELRIKGDIPLPWILSTNNNDSNRNGNNYSTTFGGMNTSMNA